MNARRFRHASILVASDNVGDAVLVKRLLGDAFDNVRTASPVPDPVACFEEAMPDIVVLAFDQLDKAQAFCQTVRHKSQSAHSHPHRTITLCTKDALRQAFTACHAGTFDDYVLFWPLAQDGLRLHMSIHIALRELAAQGQAGPAPAELAHQVRRLTEIRDSVESRIAQGSKEITRTDAMMTQASDRIDAAFDAMSARLAGGDGAELLAQADTQGIAGAITRLKEEVRRPLRQARQAMEPLSDWASALRADVQPLVHSVRTLTTMARMAKPLVLIVDDNEALRLTIGRMLESNDYHVDHAESGVHAINAVRRRRPDVILMDLSMPQMDGLQATLRIKSFPQYADVPIIMVTGRSDGAAVRDSLRAGVSDFIVKPVHSAALLRKLAKVLQQPGSGEGPSEPLLPGSDNGDDRFDERCLAAAATLTHDR
jgi:CheY-like chemotaxis protein